MIDKSWLPLRGSHDHFRKANRSARGAAENTGYKVLSHGLKSLNIKDGCTFDCLSSLLLETDAKYSFMTSMMIHMSVLLSISNFCVS
jgi:hypothetical protein